MTGSINNKPHLLDNFRTLHESNFNSADGTHSDNSSVTADYTSCGACDLDLLCREDLDFDTISQSTQFANQQALLELIDRDDEKAIPLLQANNLGYRSILPTGERLVAKLCRTQSFRILHGLSEEGSLDFNYLIGYDPVWFNYLQTSTTCKCKKLNSKDIKKLSSFLNKIANHLETVQNFSRFVDHAFLVEFCFKYNKYSLLSKIILETFPEKKQLTQEVVTKTLFNALLDKRGKTDNIVDYEIEGSDTAHNTFMIMAALKLVVFDCENGTLKSLQTVCEQISNSLGFLTGIECFERADEKSKFVLEALAKKAERAFPLLFDVGSKYHSIPFAVTRDSNDTQRATVYNTGDGVDFHPEINDTPLSFYSTETKLTNKRTLWKRLFTPPKKAEEVYDNIEALFEENRSFDPDDSIYIDALQEKGTCAFQGSMAFIQHYIFENLPGSLEEQKGAYKILKALLLSNLYFLYKSDSDPAFADLFSKKMNIHEAEILLFELAEDPVHSQNLLEEILKNKKLLSQKKFLKIKDRFDRSEVSSPFSRFYFLLRSIRYIAKTQRKPWCQNLSEKMKSNAFEKLINSLQTLKANPRN